MWPLRNPAAGGGGRVGPPKAVGDLVDVLRRRRRHDPIDHRAWKADPVFDPAGQRRRPQSGKLKHRRLEPRAVGRDVVAADQSEWRPTGLSSPLKREREQAKEGAGREAAFEVRAKRRIVEIERASRWRQAIA